MKEMFARSENGARKGKYLDVGKCGKRTISVYT
jgi:hypothetical protein